jgi:hypothetical protein
MSDDCSSTLLRISTVEAANPGSNPSYPIRVMVSRTIDSIGSSAPAEISPPTTARRVVTKTSQATRAHGFTTRAASRTLSEMASATLSGWPSVTDSEVK